MKQREGGLDVNDVMKILRTAIISDGRSDSLAATCHCTGVKSVKINERFTGHFNGHTICLVSSKWKRWRSRQLIARQLGCREDRYV